MARKKYIPKWRKTLDRAEAIAQDAEATLARAKSLAEKAVELEQEARDQHEACDTTDVPRKPRGMKLSDLTPGQVAMGLGACDDSHADGLPNNLNKAWRRTPHKRWVLETIEDAMPAKMRDKWEELKNTAPLSENTISDALPWKDLAPVVESVLDWGKALKGEFPEDSNLYDSLDWRNS